MLSPQGCLSTSIGSKQASQSAWRERLRWLLHIVATASGMTGARHKADGFGYLYRSAVPGRSEANAGDQRRTETIEIGLRLPSVGVKLISWHDISFERISIFPAPLLKGQSDYAKEDYRHRANWGSTTSGSLRIHPSTRAGRQPRRAAAG